MKKRLKGLAAFFLNPHLLLCFGLAWLITNGWSYILLAIGTLLGVEWMVAVAAAYLTFLWLPISPEKLLTFAIAIGLLRLLFPNDEKTLGTLREMRRAYRGRRQERKRQKKEKKEKTGSYEDLQ